MHDVGKMILASEMGQAYSDCMAESLATERALYLVERSRLGIDHAELGADVRYRCWRGLLGESRLARDHQQ